MKLLLIFLLFCIQVLAAMANKGPAYGMSRDVQSRIEKKYDEELEPRLIQWIKMQGGSEVGEPPEPGRYGFQQWLKNGVVRTDRP